MSRDGFAKLLSQVAKRQDEVLAETSGSDETRRQLAERVAKRSERSRRHYPPWRLAVAAGVLSAVGLFGFDHLWWPELEFRVGALQHPGTLLELTSAPEDQSLPILFSDGTLVELAPQARARVVAASRAGAEVVLESGAAHVEVTPVTRLPGEGTWRFDTGPFSVEVKGTKFDVSWEPNTNEFALDLFEGVVTVEGCGRANAIRVVAGQGVRASCTTDYWMLASIEDLEKQKREREIPGGGNVAPPTSGESEVRQVDATNVVSPTKVDEPMPIPTPVAAPLAPTPGRKEHVQSAEKEPLPTTATGAITSWLELAQAGHHRQAYERAKSMGIQAECERLGADHLLLLGNVARLSGNAEHAAYAYSALRRRFAASTHAARAAFSLGRLGVKSEPGRAAQWFETYLKEEPNGPLAQAASDWLFELAATSGEVERLRARARSYLDTYPNGAHANDARRVLERSSAEH